MTSQAGRWSDDDARSRHSGNAMSASSAAISAASRCRRRCAAAGSARGSSANSRPGASRSSASRELSLFVKQDNEACAPPVPAARLPRSALPRGANAVHGKLALHDRNRTEAKPMTRWQLAIPLTLALAAAACVQDVSPTAGTRAVRRRVAFVPPVRERRIRRDQGSRVHVRIQRGRDDDRVVELRRRAARAARLRRLAQDRRPANTN